VLSIALWLCVELTGRAGAAATVRKKQPSLPLPSSLILSSYYVCPEPVLAHHRVFKRTKTQHSTQKTAG
jgi:hypothetical protein